MQRITIDPITRLEGHGKIEIFLDERGQRRQHLLPDPGAARLRAVCVGRPVEEMAVITNRICGVCPEAHHMAAAKAADAVYHVDPPRPAKMLRELLYSAFYCTDHTTHFYALGGPDFVMGPDAPVAERNILGVIHKVGLEIGGKVIQMRKYGHTVIEMIGGRKVHPCTSIPGGMSHGITEEQRAEIERMGRWAIEFAQFSLKLFNDIVLGNERLPRPDPGRHLLPPHLLHRPGGRDQQGQLLRRQGQRGRPGRQAHRQVRAGRVHRLDRRARRAVDLPEVPLPEEGRLEGLCGRHGLRRLHGDAAVAAERRPTAWRPRWPRRSTRSSTRRWAASRCTTAWPSTGRG